MKITTWNVNGLRALLGKGVWDWVHDFRPDVLCLQEIKARPDQLTQDQHQVFEPYQAVWNPAQRPGYSGVLTLLNELEVDTNDDGPYDASADTITFVAATAVVGDYVYMISNGTMFYVSGQANADGGVTITDSD